MQRNTDRDWIRIAETDPYYGVVGDPGYHLADVDDGRLAALYQGGASEIAAIVEAIRTFEPNFEPARALDFGCGVGRHTLAMTAYAGIVTGFDIAPAMTSRASEAANRHGIRNCQLLNVLAADDRFNWINSYQVFQHIVPERGYDLLADLLDKLVDRGICSLQFTLFRERRHVELRAGALWRFDGATANAFDRKTLEGEGQIILFDYDLNHILAELVTHHVELASVAMTHSGGHHGIWVFGRRRLDGSMLRPEERYEVQSPRSFAGFLGQGWSALEEWGVWSSGRVATLNLHVPPALRDTHVLRLHGQAFVNPQHPSIVIDVSVNSQPAVRREFAEPGDDEVLEIPLAAALDDGAAAIRLAIDSPMSPVACGLQVDDTRELGFGLEALVLARR